MVGAKGSWQPIKRENGRFGGSRKLERYKPLPSDPKTCSCCKKQKTCLEFGKLATTVDGLRYYCIECCDKKERERYRLKKERAIARESWKRMDHENLCVLFEKLLAASIASVSLGMWRGVEAIKALKELKSVISYLRIEVDGEVEVGPSCSCPKFCHWHTSRMFETCTCPDDCLVHEEVMNEPNGAELEVSAG